jgi:8-oxo-dGTP diphosphatase
MWNGLLQDEFDRVGRRYAHAIDAAGSCRLVWARMHRDSHSVNHDPAWPRCAASAAVFRDGSVLLIERAKGALKGRWSLPGGHIEPGETAQAAAVREICEESGIEADLRGLVDIHEVILRRTDGALLAHYLITVFFGRWLAGEPSAGSDASAAQFVRIGDIEAYPLTDGAAALIRRAWVQVQKDVT